MDQWLWYDAGPPRNWWDGILEDVLCGLEDQGWWLACGEFGHQVACCPFQEEGDLLPARKRKRRRGGRSWRRTREPGPSPVWKTEDPPLPPPPERALLPPPEREPLPSVLLRELPLEAPVLLRAPARGATKGQEKRELLPESPELPPPEGEPLLPEREPLLLDCRESLRPEEESRLPSAQHGPPAHPPESTGGKWDMRGGGLCFRGGGCRSQSYAALHPANFLGTNRLSFIIVNANFSTNHNIAPAEGAVPRGLLISNDNTAPRENTRSARGQVGPERRQPSQTPVLAPQPPPPTLHQPPPPETSRSPSIASLHS
ncbi:UNVERIFIED_CONTAM: hypothetical protein FKN15_066516 [Acipenser sinensis]